MEIKIRLAIEEDLKSITDILNRSIQSSFTTGFTNLVTVDERTEWFKKHNPEHHPVYIAELNDELAGWISVSSYRDGREALQFTKEVSYYVAPKHFRKGIGRKLLQHAIDQAKKLNAKTFIAIVLDKNISSISLLEKFGFQKWGYLPGVAYFNGTACAHVYYGLKLA